MLKKFLRTASAFFITLAICISGAHAVVNVNSADETLLQSVKGIGPVKAKLIVEERDKNGLYKDADDLTLRVKGIGKKSIEKLQQEGLAIENGTSTAAPAVPATPAPAEPSTTPIASQASATAEK